ncbi:MAG: radical SAM protein [Archangiaceae bacterium]|nr:radical SAM protein [Archangiaceae bacterium]
MGACATFDLSEACPLRCAHCYFFAHPPEPGALALETYLARLVRLRDAYRLTTALWLGGEPLLKPELLVRAAGLFSRNAVVTSGLLPVPDDLDASLLVSIEGLEPEHDRLRGRGTYRRVLRRLPQLRERGFAVQLTLTALTLAAIDGLPQLVAETGATGVLVGFFTGGEPSPFAVSGPSRSRAVDRLLELKRTEPGLVLNPTASLELLRRRGSLAAQCPYRSRDLAFDVRLHRKAPCTYGAAADCATCGCPVLAMRAAMEAGDLASGELLRTLFKPRAHA